MPIRSRISDPYGQSSKEFSRKLREGPLPKAPDRKPSASEREPFLSALSSVPVGRTMTRSVWIDFSLPFVQTKYVLWDIEIAIYPVSRVEHDEMKTCTGVMIQSITRNRRGTQPRMMINEPYSKVWYRRILDWIDEQFYGG